MPSPTLNASDPRRFAEDIDLVYQFIDLELPEEYKTPGRNALHEWVQASAANKREFFKSLLPKAADIMAKFSKADDVEIVSAEKKGITELRGILMAAIAASQE